VFALLDVERHEAKLPAKNSDYFSTHRENHEWPGIGIGHADALWKVFVT
jgi:hypothetical protein